MGFSDALDENLRTIHNIDFVGPNERKSSVSRESSQLMDEDYKQNIKRRSEEAVAEAESARDSYLAAVTAREERQIQLRKQITKQLESIERLLRERLKER